MAGASTVIYSSSVKNFVLQSSRVDSKVYSINFHCIMLHHLEASLASV